MSRLTLTTDLSLSQLAALVVPHRWFTLEPGQEPIAHGAPHGEVYYCPTARTPAAQLRDRAPAIDPADRRGRVYKVAHRLAKMSAVWTCVGCGETVKAALR